MLDFIIVLGSIADILYTELSVSRAVFMSTSKWIFAITLAEEGGCVLGLSVRLLVSSITQQLWTAFDDIFVEVVGMVQERSD